MSHCSTCTCQSEPVPPPATSSPGVRRIALMATEVAVRAARERRGHKYGEGRK